MLPISADRLLIASWKRKWKQVVLAGIESLADAYVMTGESVYARKAGILLDRVADLYPDFDFRTQGWMYERINYSWGYVSYWQQAGEELQTIALAYDKVRGDWPRNEQLTRFLSRKAKRYKLENPMSLKPSWQETAVIVQKDAGIRFKGELCWVRWDADGRIDRIVICRGQSFSTGKVTIGLKAKTDFVEIRFDDNRAEVVAGRQENVEYIKMDNRNVWNRR